MAARRSSNVAQPSINGVDKRRRPAPKVKSAHPRKRDRKKEAMHVCPLAGMLQVDAPTHMSDPALDVRGGALRPSKRGVLTLKHPKLAAAA